QLHVEADRPAWQLFKNDERNVGFWLRSPPPLPSPLSPENMSERLLESEKLDESLLVLPPFGALPVLDLLLLPPLSDEVL
ncbi:MAG: hypothetical protein ABI276_00600, partial [Acidimicrobiales bacterium]